MRAVISVVLEELSGLDLKAPAKQGALNVGVLQRWPDYLVLTCLNCCCCSELANVDQGGSVNTFVSFLLRDHCSD